MLRLSLRSFRVRLFLCGRQTLFPQMLDGLFDVVVGFLLRILAIHDARAGFFTQFFDKCAVACHSNRAPLLK